MPSPVGHALGGLIVGLAIRPGTLGPPSLARWFRASSGEVSPKRPSAAEADTSGTVRTLGTLACAAVLPDIDFLWGRHNMETHSLGAAVLAGLAVLAWTRGKNPRLALAVTLAWSTHVLFDWLGSDDTPPLGVMALWPLNSGFYFANAFVFDAISRRYWLPNFVSHNVWAITKEIAMLAPVAAILSFRKVLNPSEPL